MMEITRNNRFLFHVSKHSKDILRQDVRILRADLASTAFSKIIIAVYGQIIKKGRFVRKFGLNCVSSTAFKNAEQKQSQSDHLHSAFHLIQVKSGTFSKPLSTNPLRQFS